MPQIRPGSRPSTLSSSVFINHPTIRRRIFRVTDTDVKSTIQRKILGYLKQKSIFKNLL